MLAILVAILLLLAPFGLAGQDANWPAEPRLAATLSGRTPEAWGHAGRDAWQQPKDSTYRRARELLNAGEYRRAADLFREFRQKNPEPKALGSAMYWEAFARYRTGADAELRAADELLTALRQQPEFASETEVRSLALRVAGALAARGDAAAARRLRETTGVEPACDREDSEIRAEALSALLQSDPANSIDVLRRVAAKQDDCSAMVRGRAVVHLARLATQPARALLAEMATGDPNPEVRGEAIGALARQPDGVGLALIGSLLDKATDERTFRVALSVLARSPDADASQMVRRIIERADLTDNVRTDAIRSLLRRRQVQPAVAVRSTEPARSGQSGDGPSLSDADAAFLKGIYERNASPAIRRAIVEVMPYAAPASRDGWILSLLKNPSTDSRERATLLAGLRRSDVAIEEVIRLYDVMAEREARSMLVGILASRPEPAATDKLVEIAKRGTDPSIRRDAIGALARKNDPRTTKLLLELVER